MINLGLSCVKLSTKWSKVYFNSIWQCSLDVLKLDRLVDGQVEALLSLVILSKPELNHNSTQPQSPITLVVGLDTKMTLHTPTQPTLLHKLNVSNISAVTDLILMKL